MRRLLLASVVLAGLVAALPAPAQTQTFKVVMHSDVKALDPVWSGAYITRNHGYMLYDTLFALDENLQVKPQMVDKWETSPDGLTWTFTLRDGLEFHDGAPVTSEDVIASLKRWASRDSMGQKLAAYTAEARDGDRDTHPARRMDRRMGGAQQHRDRGQAGGCHGVLGDQQKMRDL